MFDVYAAVVLQHGQRRTEQEKELLEKKVEWLTEELKNKTEELLNTHREKGSEILELQSNLKNSKEQVSFSRTSIGAVHLKMLEKWHLSGPYGHIKCHKYNFVFSNRRAILRSS